MDTWEFITVLLFVLILCKLENLGDKDFKMLVPRLAKRSKPPSI